MLALLLRNPALIDFACTRKVTRYSGAMASPSLLPTRIQYSRSGNVTISELKAPYRAKHSRWMKLELVGPRKFLHQFASTASQNASGAAYVPGNVVRKVASLS